jgi:putative nucleotidyltransferase with HDIG domain
VGIVAIVDGFRWAFGHAEAKLANDQPRRWTHVQGVAQKAASLGELVSDDAEMLRSAAILHDIGYASDLVVTGFHPLDGANHLLGQGVERRVVDLVAHHSAAVVEAGLRGLEEEIGHFTDEGGAVRDALWYCDLTTSPDGCPVSASKRLSEIRERYGRDHVVTVFIDMAEDELMGAVRRTQRRLALMR